MNRETWSRHSLVGTGTTSSIIEKELNLPVKKPLIGPLGGGQQLGAMIAQGKMDLVLFFWEPLKAQPHDSDVKALIRLAVAWNIIVTCNVTTAALILASPLTNEDYEAATADV